MTDPNKQRKEEALEMAADRALFGGDNPALDLEIARLVADGLVTPTDLRELDDAAAGIHLAASIGPGVLEPMPAALRAKVLQNAAARPSLVPAASASVRPQMTVRMAQPSVPAPVIPLRPNVLRAKTFWIAMAACVALGFGLSQLADRVRGPVAQKDPPGAELPLAAARAALLANAPDVVTLPWTATDDPSAKGASGDVVWSAAQQRGFMRFTGLAANDPKRVQYQLWMFDAQRDERYPVDGGVFDVGPDGEVIVPITPRVSVAQAKLFAVTVEVPGGVVVSKRERIVTTAAPKT